MYLKLFILTIIVLAIAFAGFAIKMFVKKDGEFKKQCSTIDPHTGKNLGCSCEGAPGDGSCRKDDDKHANNHTHVSSTLSQIKELQID